MSASIRNRDLHAAKGDERAHKEHCVRIAHEVERVCRTAERTLARLIRQPATVYQVLTGTCEEELTIDFAGLDRASELLDELEKHLGPQGTVEISSLDHSVEGLRDLLRQTLANVEPLRKARSAA